MKRSLRLFDVTCMGINAIVGSGIFLLPDDLYREMGALSPLAFVLCAVGLLPIALCYAEASSGTEATGGPYVYAREAFGPWVGFVVGWMCLANALFSFAAVACAGAAYLGNLLPVAADLVSEKIVAVLGIVAFSALNYRGARPGATAVNLFTIAKFSALMLLVGALIPQVSWAQAQSGVPKGAMGVGSAVFLALFAAQGFEVVPVPAGETQKARRVMPIAILTSLLLSSMLYFGVQAVLVSTTTGLARVSDTPLADAALKVAPLLGVVVAAGGIISTFGFVAGSALGTPRYAYAAAVDRFLPQSLAQTHSVFQSPHRAIVATAVVAIALAIAFDYRALVGMSNVSVAVQYLATCLAVLQLRRKGVLSSFRAPGGWFTPLTGALVSLWVFTEASAAELLFALAALVAGVVVWRLSR